MEGVAIGQQFDFGGHHYGLAVPIYERMLEHPHSEPTLTQIILTDKELDLAIRMLQDLRESRQKTLRSLQAGAQ